jgi:hypothetical protein
LAKTEQSLARNANVGLKARLAKRPQCIRERIFIEADFTVEAQADEKYSRVKIIIITP